MRKMSRRKNPKAPAPREFVKAFIKWGHLDPDGCLGICPHWRRLLNSCDTWGQVWTKLMRMRHCSRDNNMYDADEWIMEVLDCNHHWSLIGDNSVDSPDYNGSFEDWGKAVDKVWAICERNIR